MLVAMVVLVTVSATAETLEGAWLLEPNTPSYVEIAGKVVKSGIVYDLAVLANPAIKGDRVYRDIGDGSFFYRDQLTLAMTPIFKILPGAKSFKEDPIGGRAPVGELDGYDWSLYCGGQFPYLFGTTLRLKDSRPDRIYLTDDEFVGDKNWSHYFNREDLVLLNPSCLPEKIPESKLK